MVDSLPPAGQNGPSLTEVLSRLEEVLLDLDELEAHLPAAFVDQAITSIRTMMKL